ncbi:hypothetical protein [Brasilonema bromeliae]|uniref:Uncharacterized protein n=1 Tax=Brasilonema bromeliae SPC951 TaxID=385972 RepID=A0ABX1PBI4_9CYAN|nr:hypothetical protein [Brasilonema bromeliae]NMG20956.1 hypothetical protein [Brasilonema bromeliae SPC951]
MVQPNIKTINTPFIGIIGPSQYLGVKLTNFSFSQLFLVRDQNNANEKESPLKQQITKAREKMYENIVNNLNGLISLNDKEEGVKTIYVFDKYEDFFLKTQFRPDRERMVIRITRITPRETRVSTICRIYTTGTHIYIALDSYLLGKINIFSLVIHTLLLLIFVPMFFTGLLGFLGALVLLLPTLFNPSNINALLAVFSGLLLPFIPGLYLYFSWFPVVKALLNKESFKAALKHRFHNRRFTNLFDEDDGLTYLKSVTPFIIDQITNALASYGIKDETIFSKLNEIKEAILAQPTISLNNSGIMSNVLIGNNNFQSSK